MFKIKNLQGKFMTKFLLTFFLMTFSLCSAEFKYKLSICAIFQNEAPYLKEWIDYHRKVGVEHFWLYNNNSEDDYQAVLDPYIKEGVVQLIEWYSEIEDVHSFIYIVQCGSYNHCLDQCRGVTQWLAMIDCDEFIVPKYFRNIQMMLDSFYPNCSGVCVNWQCFGTSHVEKCPDGSTLPYLTKKMKWNHLWNQQIKSIVKPEHVKNCTNPHFCLYKPGYWHVNTSLQRVSCISPVDISMMQINHYWTRDEFYLHNRKIPRYTKWGGSDSTQGVLEHAEKMNDEDDYFILELVN